LLERIVLLSKEFNSSDRFALLSSGVVGDRDEVAPILPHFDNVSFVVKFCGAIKSLKNQQDHDAPDIREVTIANDPDWRKMTKIRLARKSHPPFDPSRVEKLLSILERGAEYWNDWRSKNPNEYIDLRGVSLFGKDLSLDGANLAAANLSDANLARVSLQHADLSAVYAVNASLPGTHLESANLRGAFLRQSDLNLAHLPDADLRLADLSDARLFMVDCDGANLRRAKLASADARSGSFSRAILAQSDLSDALLGDANLSGADMSHSNLSGASLVRANLGRATLHDSRVFGASVWKTDLHEAGQDRLIVTPKEESDILVDNMKVAQFFYLILNNEEIRDVLDTVTSKAVLILGRFTQQRKRVLDELRRTLRSSGYVPVLFDFEKPRNRDLIETVATLASLARFVIADITSPKAVPEELGAIVPALPSLPVQPIIHSSESDLKVFEDFRKYPSFLPPHRYDCLETLLACFDEKVVQPAEKKARELAEGPSAASGVGRVGTRVQAEPGGLQEPIGRA